MSTERGTNRSVPNEAECSEGQNEEREEHEEQNEEQNEELNEEQKKEWRNKEWDTICSLHSVLF